MKWFYIQKTVLHSPAAVHSPIAQNRNPEQQDSAEYNGSMMISLGYRELLKFDKPVKSEETMSYGALASPIVKCLPHFDLKTVPLFQRDISQQN